MNIMTGCLSATAGCVRIGGYDIFEEPDKAKRLIGYLPEQPPLYMNETPLEYLKFVGEAKGLKRRALADQIETVLSQTKLEEVKNLLISKLSKGYRQRVGIAQTLLGSPKVIILDEPTVGLDPLQIIEIRDLIKQLGQEHTVILSSHILSEVQAICEKVLIIAGGRLVAFDRPGNLEKLMMASHAVSWQICELDDGRIHVEVQAASGETEDICRSIFFAFAGKDKALLELTSKKANLEDVFIELTENDTTGPDTIGKEPEESEARADKTVESEVEEP